MSEHEADYAVRLTGRLSRISWAVQAIASGRERNWRVMDQSMDERLARFPQLTQVGPRLRATRPKNWWWLELQLEQMVTGPYVAELAEFEP